MSRTDTDRLEWLVKNVISSDFGINGDPQKRIGWNVDVFNAPLAYGPTWREAIDAAMDSDEEKELRTKAFIIVDVETSHGIDAGVEQWVFVADKQEEEPPIDPNKQPQCNICGLFMARTVPNNRPYPYGSTYPNDWKCVRVHWDSYYDAWEHD